MHIRDIMTTRVATVSMDDRLRVIRDIFEQAHFRHLLVLEEEELVGVIRIGICSAPSAPISTPKPR